LLGGFSPLLEQLLKHLAAITQAQAVLEVVDHRDRLVRDPEKHFLLAGGRNAAPVRADMPGNGVGIGFNGGTLFLITCKPS
jgi:hypothetical protein